MKLFRLKDGNYANQKFDKRAWILIGLILGCFAVSPTAQAVSPPPDGGYPGANTAEGKDALFSLTTGSNNTATGYNALYSNRSGAYNTATGDIALRYNTTGEGNTATGSGALLHNTTGGGNTANGSDALISNQTGNANTATGEFALQANRSSYNTATGSFSLPVNTVGTGNTATGYATLAYNTTGNYNTVTGGQAMFYNITGNENTATGYGALELNDSGSANTAEGVNALLLNNGSYNTATGQNALYHNGGGHNNTADGRNALKNNSIGSNNVGVGSNAGINLTTGDNNIDIGSAGVAGDAGTIRIGTVGTHTKTFIAGISDAAIGGMEVRVNQNGRLGTVPSSERFKEAIKPMDNASRAILALKPVTFRYKKEIDAAGISQFGLVAEEVEKVNPALIVRDKEGKPYSVRYDQVNAMLLNEFLKEHRKVEQLEKQVAALTAGLQEVSTQLEASKPAPQTVLNSP